MSEKIKCQENFKKFFTKYHKLFIFCNNESQLKIGFTENFIDLLKFPDLNEKIQTHIF